MTKINVNVIFIIHGALNSDNDKWPKAYAMDVVIVAMDANTVVKVIQYDYSISTDHIY